MSRFRGRQQVRWLRETIHDLAKDPAYGNLNAVCGAVQALTGLSMGFLQKFRQGHKQNVTVKTLDTMTDALEKLSRSRAA